MQFYLSPRQFGLYLSLAVCALGFFLLFSFVVLGVVVLALGGIGVFATNYVGVHPAVEDDSEDETD
jgi:hypothetical protein